MPFIRVLSQKWLRSKRALHAFILLSLLASVVVIYICRENYRMANAPHFAAKALNSAYNNQPLIARKQFDHKFMFVTGYVDGMDEGLFGDGCIRMNGIRCDVGGDYGDCGFGRECTVVGICDGIDQYGLISLSYCRVIAASRR